MAAGVAGTAAGVGKVTAGRRGGVAGVAGTAGGAADWSAGPVAGWGTVFWARSRWRSAGFRLVGSSMVSWATLVAKKGAMMRQRWRKAGMDDMGNGKSVKE